MQVLRGLTGLTQHEVAQRLGLSQQSVARLEGGRFAASVSSLKGMADLFAVHQRWLRDGTLPVFSTPAVFFSLPSYPRPFHRMGMIDTILKELLPAFLREAHVAAAWHTLGPLFVFRSGETWIFLHSGMFGLPITDIFDSLPLPTTLIPVLPQKLYEGWKELANVLPELAPYLELQDAQVQQIISSIQEQSARAGTLKEAVVGRLRTKIQALLDAGGVSAQDVLGPLLNRGQDADVGE